MSAHDFSIKMSSAGASKGEEVTAKELFGGKVALIVNVASQCGLTGQYKGLESLYQKYKDKGFVVVGFPSNEFGAQEPGTDEEIAEFTCSRFKASFPLTAKVEVNGANAHPLWAYMKKEKKELFLEAIKWNFSKVRWSSRLFLCVASA